MKQLSYTFHSKWSDLKIGDLVVWSSIAKLNPLNLLFYNYSCNIMDASLPKVYKTLLSVVRHIIMELLLQNQMVACMVYSMHSVYSCDTFMQMQGVVYVSFNDWINEYGCCMYSGGGGGGN